MILPLNFKRDSFRQVVCKLGIVRCKHHLLPVFLSTGHSVAATSLKPKAGEHVFLPNVLQIDSPFSFQILSTFK